MKEIEPIVEAIKKLARLRALIGSLEMSEEEIRAEIRRIAEENSQS